MSGTLEDLATQAANTYGVPISLFLSQIGAESGWNPNAVSPTGAIGLGQILPSTAANPGLGLAGINPGNLTDPETNLNFAASYDAALYNQTGSWGTAMQAYNEGLGNATPANVANLSPAYQALYAQGNALSGASTATGADAWAGPGTTIGAPASAQSGTGWLGFPTLGTLDTWISGALPRAGFIAVGLVLLLIAGFLFVFSGKDGAKPVPIPI